MLLGRAVECARIEALLTDARRRVSGALVIRGEPGIGKTALLDYARTQARDMVVLRSRGVQSETDLPFSGLAELLAPVTDAISGIPEPQAAAIAGALALGPPTAIDRFRVSAATLSVLAAAAEEDPLLAIVDDAHWLDASSAEALLFAARRLGSEGVVMLFGLRGETENLPGVAALPELILGGLDEESAATLATAVLGRSVPSRVGSRLRAATGGNPLAIIEAVTAMELGDLLGDGALLESLPILSAEQAFMRNITRLPEPVRRALAVTAANDSNDTASLYDALRRLAIDPDALLRAEDANLIAVDANTVTFRHPLIRSAAYHAVPPSDRRQIHRALADAFAERGKTDRSAWHLAASSPEPDEAVASALEAAAGDALARTGYSGAANAFERAARLTPGSRERARRLLQAANACFLAGELDRASDLVDVALELSDDPVLQADLRNLQGRLLMWLSPSRARGIVLEEADRAPDKERAATALVTAAMTCIQEGRLEEAVEHSHRAVDVGQGLEGPVPIATYMALATSLGCRGDIQRAREIAMRVLAVLLNVPAPEGQGELASFGLVLGWLELYEEASRFLDAFIRDMRALSAPSALPYPLAAKARIDFRVGAWDESLANAHEAVELSVETRQTASLAHSLLCLAETEAGRGAESDCREHVAAGLELERKTGAESLQTLGAHALGLLELGAGRPADAIPHLERAAKLARKHGLGNPNVVTWHADLFEAYLAVGRRHDANQILTELDDVVRLSESPSASVSAVRCRALKGTKDDFEPQFAEALELHAGLPRPFERARTDLYFGQRLRREGRRSDARVHLRAAMEIFDELGATGWIETARQELHATGDAVRRQPRGSRELTPQELRVALVIAKGASNREAAAALFLSAKTIEFHLANIYRKLGLRSRTELAAAFARHESSR
ncbi:MAG: AAA family ATPase [Actinomycetota bacterium]|nr:AAA family ATPase [Actinomycetota bacterium]